MLFLGLPICHSIHIIVKMGHNYGNPAEQILPHIHFSAYSEQFHTNIQHADTFHVLKNICLFHSTIPPWANQSSYFAAECPELYAPAPAHNNSRHRPNMPRFCSRSTPPWRAEIVPAPIQLPCIVCGSIIPAHNNIDAALPKASPPQSSSDIF